MWVGKERGGVKDRKADNTEQLGGHWKAGYKDLRKQAQNI